MNLTKPKPFDRDSTTDDVLRGVDLTGKLAVVTGGAAGLGLQTATALASAGAKVVIGARSLPALQSAAAALGGAAEAHALDLRDPRSVDAFADAVLKDERPIDLLINNAGIMATPEARTPLGIESQLATNFVGHAQLTSRLSHALAAAGSARVVSLSSSGHHISPVALDDLNFERRPYHPFVAYGQSKTACALLAVKVAKHLRSKGVTAHAVHPGMIETDLGQYITDKDRAEMAAAMGPLAATLPAFKSIAAGAATTTWAATAPELVDRHALYLEDCKIAERVPAPNFAFGVLDYALDEATADELWAAAEKLLKRSLPL